MVTVTPEESEHAHTHTLTDTVHNDLATWTC